MKKFQLRNIIREVIKEQLDIPTASEPHTYLCPGLYALSKLITQSGEISLNHCTQEVYDWIANDLSNPGSTHPHSNISNIAGSCAQFTSNVTAGTVTDYNPHTMNGIQFAFTSQTECEASCTPCEGGTYQISVNDRPSATDDRRTTTGNTSTIETCNASISHILPTNILQFQFSGPSNWAYEVNGPDPLGNINTLISSNNSSSQTVFYNGPLNPGTYTLKYQCNINSQSNITLTQNQSITIS